MEQEQNITSKADLRKWRIELPNLYDDSDLDPYEFRLLAHYVRVGNCYEGTRTTAAKCKMSPAQVVEKRRSLAGKGFIKLGENDLGTISIEIVDLWAKNFRKFSTRSRGERDCSPREHHRSPRERKKEPSKERTIEESGGSKNEPPAPKVKSPAAEKAIALASDALQEFGRKNDVQVDLGTAVADPRKAERLFLDRVTPMIAAIFPNRGKISDDRVVAKRIYALRVDPVWLEERLIAYTNGAGDEFRHPAKDGRQPTPFWVWKTIEREWSVYRKEKQDADERKARQADYERRVAAALAGDPAPEQDRGRPYPDSVHLHDTAGGPGGNAGGDESGEAGIAVDAERELCVRGDRVGVHGVPQSPVGAADGQVGVAGVSRSVREMFRDEQRRRYLAAVDGKAQKQRDTPDGSPSPARARGGAGGPRTTGTRARGRDGTLF